MTLNDSYLTMKFNAPNNIFHEVFSHACSCALFAIFTLSACSKQPDEQILRSKLAAMAEAIEEKKPSDVMDQLHEDFFANDGIDKRAVRRMLALHFLRNKKIFVTIPKADVSLDSVYGDRATLHFAVLLTGAQGLIPDRGNLYNVTSHWIKDSDQWQLRRLHWEAP